MIVLLLLIYYYCNLPEVLTFPISCTMIHGYEINKSVCVIYTMHLQGVG
jgi:hypothetical protein